MFGELEQGDTLATKEDKEKYTIELFNLTATAPFVLELYKLVSIEDYESCIDYVKTIKENIPKILGKAINKNI